MTDSVENTSAEVAANAQSAAQGAATETPAAQNPAPVASQPDPEPFQVPESAAVEEGEGTLPVALRPCPAGPADHPRFGERHLD